MQKLVQDELRQELRQDSDPADTVRLVLHDAGTFDIASGTGGLNGSIRLRSVCRACCTSLTQYIIFPSFRLSEGVKQQQSGHVKSRCHGSAVHRGRPKHMISSRRIYLCSEELNRPENTDLKPIVDRLKSVKAKIEEQTKDSKLHVSS